MWQAALKIWAFIADTLAVAGVDWKATALYAALTTGLVWVIGILTDAPWFQIAVGLPVVFAACMVASALARSVRLARWLHPRDALEKLTDSDLRDKRDKVKAERDEVQTRIWPLERQIGDAEREAKWALDRLREAGHPVPDHPIASDHLNGLYMEISKWNMHKGNLETALQNLEGELLLDLYNKLQSGQLVAKGFKVPHQHAEAPIEILHAEWLFLKFATVSPTQFYSLTDQARGGSIEYMAVRVKKA